MFFIHYEFISEQAKNKHNRMEPKRAIRMMERSLIFVNGDDSTYNNKYVEGSNQMIWKGQNSGLRDNRVVPGTRVWWRRTHRKLAFMMIGTVNRVELLTPGNHSAGIPATYRLFLDLEENPQTIEKAVGDHRTHQTILREEGFGEDVVRSAFPMPNGIY